MTVYSQAITDIAGAGDQSRFWFYREDNLSPSADESAIITGGWVDVQPVDGVLTTPSLTPGPAKVSWGGQAYDLIIPDHPDDDPIPLWPDIQNYLPQPGPVVSAAVAAKEAAVAARDAAQEILADVESGVVPDAGVAARVAASGSATRTAVEARVRAVGDATYVRPGDTATAAAGTHRYLSLEAEDLRDLNELWDGDSIGNETVEHIYLLTQMRAALNPTRSYVYHLIDSSTGLTWNAPVTVQTGTGTGNAGGPFTTHIWNFSVSGMNTSYSLGSRYPVLLATNPDIIVLLHGKNEGQTSGGSTDAHWRGQYLSFTESIHQDLPFADLVCVLQIPNRDDQEMAKKNRVYAQLAALRGYGVIDLHRLFLAAIKKAGGTLSAYMKADGIHPTTSADAPSPNGSLLMAQLELAYWTFNRETGAIRAQQVSSLESNGDQLLVNGDFSDWTGSVPAGWEAINATTSKDTRSGYFEKVTGTGYGCRVQSSSAASSYIRVTFDAAFRAKWAGKPLTAVVRVRADTKSPTDSVTQGRIGWTDGIQTLNSGNYAQARDGFHYKVLTFTPDPAATYLRLTLYADSAATATADVTFDRVWVVPGILPRKGSMGVQGPAGAAGAAGDPSLTQIDFCSTVGSNPVVAALTVTGSSSAVIGTANMGIVMPVKPHRNMSIAVLEWVTGSVSAGNYDIAILDSAGARLWSKGSTAWPATSTNVAETVSPAVSLVAGQTYYIVLAADNTTATYKGLNTTSSLLKLVTGAGHTRAVGSIFPIPSTVTIGSTATGKLPLVLLREA
ncbi:SGNH/GDSL hydrolase family protein [Rhodococcus opacus]|uniref:SGNH/GDSL hydrolase family protein n=1 Tax=Rhodococcus opacus TaxID=37919 RepID=UPI0034D18FE2